MVAFLAAPEAEARSPGPRRSCWSASPAPGLRRHGRRLRGVCPAAGGRAGDRASADASGGMEKGLEGRRLERCPRAAGRALVAALGPAATRAGQSLLDSTRLPAGPSPGNRGGDRLADPTRSRGGPDCADRTPGPARPPRRPGGLDRPAREPAKRGARSWPRSTPSGGLTQPELAASAPQPIPTRQRAAFATGSWHSSARVRAGPGSFLDAIARGQIAAKDLTTAHVLQVVAAARSRRCCDRLEAVWGEAARTPDRPRRSSGSPRSAACYPRGTRATPLAASRSSRKTAPSATSSSMKARRSAPT